MKDDPLAGLKRLGDDAMGPCAMCKRQLLETGLPVFYRITAAQCGLDAKEIQKHVGLAMAMGGGTDGLALAGIMGPKVEPVVVMNDAGTFNVCHSCAQRHGIELVVMAVAEMQNTGPAEGGA